MANPCSLLVSLLFAALLLATSSMAADPSVCSPSTYPGWGMLEKNKTNWNEARLRFEADVPDAGLLTVFRSGQDAFHFCAEAPFTMPSGMHLEVRTVRDKDNSVPRTYKHDFKLMGAGDICCYNYFDAGFPDGWVDRVWWTLKKN